MGPRSVPYRPDRPIVAELAAGAVVRHEVSGEFLLLHDPSEDRWCFPKGHVEPGESLEETARREVAEETGLRRFTLHRELREVRYRFYREKSSANVLKVVVYFLASTPETRVAPEPLFDRAEWVSIGEVRGRLRFPADLEVLEALVVV